MLCPLCEYELTRPKGFQLNEAACLNCDSRFEYGESLEFAEDLKEYRLVQRLSHVNSNAIIPECIREDPYRCIEFLEKRIDHGIPLSLGVYIVGYRVMEDRRWF